tara:strand:+ start:79767 stop:79958 length:192 start_codon:yes stop_codon:yes gene_type:complete
MHTGQFMRFAVNRTETEQEYLIKIACAVSRIIKNGLVYLKSNSLMSSQYVERANENNKMTALK